MSGVKALIGEAAVILAGRIGIDELGAVQAVTACEEGWCGPAVPVPGRSSAWLLADHTARAIGEVCACGHGVEWHGVDGGGPCSFWDGVPGSQCDCLVMLEPVHGPGDEWPGHLHTTEMDGVTHSATQ